MAIDLKLTSEEKKQINKFAKPQTPVKLLNPKEKIKESSEKTLPIRGH